MVTPVFSHYANTCENELAFLGGSFEISLTISKISFMKYQHLAEVKEHNSAQQQH